MGIAEVREELSSPSGFAGQATALIGRKWKTDDLIIGRQWQLEDAAIAALTEQKKSNAAALQEMLKTRFEKATDLTDSLHKLMLENPDDAHYKAAYDKQVGNMARAEAQWATSLGVTPQQVLKDTEIILPLVDEISKEPGEFSKHGTWNKSTLSLINKKYEQLGLPPPDPEIAEILWKGRIKQKNYKGVDASGVAGTQDSRLIRRHSFAGIAAELLGTVPDFISEVAEGAGEISRSIWEGRNYVTPLEGPYTLGDRTSREFLRKAFGVESDTQQLERILRGDESSPRPAQRIEEAGQTPTTITPTGQSVKMGPFSVLDKFTGTDAGLIDGFLAQEEEPTLMGIDATMIGETASRELKALDEAAKGELSREAMEFLRSLEIYVDQYGRDRAIRLLSGDYLALSDADKKAIEKYLTQ